MNIEQTIWRRALLTETAIIQDAVQSLDHVGIKMALIVSEAGELIGTISDGDIRRGLLRGLDMSSPITTVIHRNPLVAPREMERETILQMMIANKVLQIPVVDDRHRVIGLHLWDEIHEPQVRHNLMVIMAGGKGTRLHPHTESCPKPMLSVGGKPMLELIIERAIANGFSHFILAVHYLGHMIEEYFGDGKQKGVRIEYLREQTPLGTAGALSLMPKNPEAPFVVTNGDILTNIHYGNLLDFHMRHEAAATMAVRLHEWQNPFGVVKIQGVDIIGFEEKPIARSHINAGVYVLAPEALDVLVAAEPCNMPTLFERLQTRKKRTVVYLMHEHWLDVGRPSDYETAQCTGGVA